MTFGPLIRFEISLLRWIIYSVVRLRAFKKGKERDTIKAAKDAWVEYANARTLLSYSENEATIAKELLTIAQKERAADQTDAAAVLAAEEALEGALKDLSDDSMSLLTTVYEILDVINLLEPDMVEDTSRVGTFNTSS